MMVKYTLLLFIFLLNSCQHNRSLPSTKSVVKKKIVKQTPMQKHKKCIRENPKSIVCNWELGWLYYAEGDWRKVQHHWNISRYITKSEKFRNHIEQKLKLINDLAALQNLSIRYKKTMRKNTNRKIAAQADFTFTAVGDVMLGIEEPNAVLPYRNLDPFKEIKDVFPKGSLNFVNLEGTFCDNEKAQSKCKDKSKKCYSFKTPTKYFNRISSTFNLASLANNHTLDYGLKCLKETQDLLDKNKIHYANGIDKISSFYHNNLKVAFIAFHTGRFFKYNVNRISEAVNYVKALDKKHDIVLVSFHGGAEGLPAVRVPYELETFYGEKRGELIKFAHKLVDNGADIIIGHGPHIVRGIELYKDKVIAYSLGNFLTYGPFNLSGLLKNGLVLEVNTDKKGRFLAGKVTSTVQDLKGSVRLDNKLRSLNYIRALSKIDFPKSQLNFNHTGEIDKN